MSWLNNLTDRFIARKSRYNNSVCMDKVNLELMVAEFDNIFDTIINFTDEIASLQIYPIKIKPKLNPTGINKLRTSRGVDPSINAYNIDDVNSYVTLGEYEVKNKFNNFADYKGYTQIKLFLPFLGFVDVDVNECMGKWLQFRLYIDFFSGKGMYIIGVSNNSISSPNTPYADVELDADMRVISTFETPIGIDIPLGKSNLGDIQRNIVLGTVKTAVSAYHGAYIMDMPSAKTVQKSVKTYDIKGRSKAKGSRMKQIQSGTETTVSERTYHKPVDKVKPIADSVNSSIDILNNINIHSNTDRINDSMLMWATSMQVQVIIYRPKFIIEQTEYGALYGHPLGEIRKLNNLGGYTEINAVHIEGEGFDTITQGEVELIEECFSLGILLPFNTIDFRIGLFSYQAKNGMTWSEWVDSKYNINGYQIVGTYLFSEKMNSLVHYIDPNDVIISDKRYTDKPYISSFVIYKAEDGKAVRYNYPYTYTWNDFIPSKYNINKAFSINSQNRVCYNGAPINEGILGAIGTTVYRTYPISNSFNYQAIPPVTFKINGVEYKANDNMTLSQWVNSTYNINNYEIIDGFCRNVFLNEIVIYPIDSVILNGDYIETEEYNRTFLLQYANGTPIGTFSYTFLQTWNEWIIGKKAFSTDTNPGDYDGSNPFILYTGIPIWNSPDGSQTTNVRVTGKEPVRTRTLYSVETVE